MKRQYFLSTTVIWLALYQICTMGIASADTPCTNTNDGCVVVNNEVLEITLEDIVPDGRTVHLVGNGKIGEDTLSTSNPFSVNTQITRTISNLWQYQIDVAGLNDLQVQYTPSDSFSLTKGSSEIKVDISPIPPISLGQGATPDKQIVQGGATLNLDLSQVTTSGIHSGNLQITITEF